MANLESKSIPWVYDVTLFCEETPPPTLTSVLLGQAAKAHMYIRRFKLEEIPKEDVTDNIEVCLKHDTTIFDYEMISDNSLTDFGDEK